MSVNEWTNKWCESKSIRSRYFREIESTNEVAKEEFIRDDSVDLSVYVSEHQTKGKGRGGNSWQDEGKGSSLLASLSFKPEQPPQPILTPLLGLALYKAVNEVWPKIKWGMKAPNDLMIDGVKVAGLLVDTLQQGSSIRIIIGLGLNIESSPKELGDQATHLKAHLGGEELTETLWYQFLDSLHWNFKQALGDGHMNHLSTSIAEEIKAALNNNPNLNEKVSKLHLDGSIEIGNQVTPWHKL